MVSEIEDDKVDDDYEEPLSEDYKEEAEDYKEESEDYKEESDDHTEQSGDDGDEFDDDEDEIDLDDELEASPKERAARALEIRRALEVRDEQRRLSEDLDYLEFDDD
jgi:hypothetical protein